MRKGINNKKKHTNKKDNKKDYKTNYKKGKLKQEK